jgi:hypothetical protein
MFPAGTAVNLPRGAAAVEVELQVAVVHCADSLQQSIMFPLALLGWPSLECGRVP